MHIFLSLCAVLAFLVGGSAMVDAKSAIHQILGGVAFIAAFVALAGAGVIDAVRSQGRKLDKLDKLDAITQQLNGLLGRLAPPPGTDPPAGSTLTPQENEEALRQLIERHRKAGS